MTRGYVDGPMDETLEAWAARWWANVDAHWANLRALIERWHPSSSQAPEAFPPLEVTAARVEPLRQLFAGNIAKESAALPPVADRAEAARAGRDHETFAAILNEAWMGVPESTSCWEIPGFGVLCELCGDPPPRQPEPDEAPTKGGDA